MARSCRCAVARISAISSSLLITMMLVDQLGRVDEARIAELAVLEVLAERVPHRALRDQPDGGAGEFRHRLVDVLEVERGGERRTHEIRRGEEALDAAPHRIARRRRRVDPERPRRDHGHQVVLREDHRRHGAVAGRQVGEPFDVAAGELVGVLHHQHVDLAAPPSPRARPPSAARARRWRSGEIRRSAMSDIAGSPFESADEPPQLLGRLDVVIADAEILDPLRRAWLLARRLMPAAFDPVEPHAVAAACSRSTGSAGSCSPIGRSPVTACRSVRCSRADRRQKSIVSGTDSSRPLGSTQPS